MAGSIGEIKVKVGANIKSLQKGLYQSQRELNAFGRKVGRIGDGINRNITLPFALAGAAGVKLAVDFESSMSKIVGQVGIARGEVEEMKGSILEMAGRTARAPKELADAMFFIQSAGLRSTAAMEALEFSAKAAAAGFGETKVVADLVTSAMNAYGSEVLNAEQATDILAATVREGKAQAEDLTNAMGYALPMATAMGISFNDLGAAVAGMTRTGTGAETAVTQLTQIMMTFQKPMKQTEEVAGMLGTTMGELRDRIGKEGLMPVLVELRQKLKEAGIETAEFFREKRALAGVLDLTGGNMKDNIAIMERMKNTTGDAEHAFEAASETAEFKLNKALANLKTAGIELGQTLVPMVTQVADAVGKLARGFAALDDDTKKAITSVLLWTSGVGIALKAVSSFYLGLGSVVRVMADFTSKTANGEAAMKRYNRTLAITKSLAGVLGVGLLALGAYMAANKKLKEDIDGAADAQDDFNKILNDTNDLYVQANTDVGKAAARASLYSSRLKELKEEAARLQEQINSAPPGGTSLGLSKQLAKINDQIKEFKKLAIEFTATQKLIFDNIGNGATEGDLISAMLGVVPEGLVEDINAITEAIRKAVEQNEKDVKANEEKKKKQEALAEIHQDLNKALKENNTLWKLNGNYYEKLKGDASALSSAIDGLIGEGLDETNPKLQEMQTQLEGVLKEIDRFDSRKKIEPLEMLKKKEDEDPLLPPLDPTIGASYRKAAEDVIALNQAVNSILETGIESGLADMASSLGDVMTGAAESGSILASVLNSIAGVMSQLGKLAIGTGIAVLGIKKALESLNPAVAIAGGLALIALSRVVKSKAASLVSNDGPKGYAQGGRISGPGVGGGNAYGDNIPILAKAGEAILNRQQINALGGPSVLGSIGVPGFAKGGMVGAYSSPDVGAPSRSMARDTYINLSPEVRIDGEDFVLRLKEIERTIGGHSIA